MWKSETEKKVIERTNDKGKKEKIKIKTIYIKKKGTSRNESDPNGRNGHLSLKITLYNS